MNWKHFIRWQNYLWAKGGMSSQKGKTLLLERKNGNEVLTQ
ncbi:hypothetical protein [Psychrobacillus insolitus]|nr:hypothetical protein [Psychrobacillus insolitus]